jgi:4-amino-4-deoxy-L-arabinose transferase-like glycosyltransferase
MSSLLKKKNKTEYIAIFLILGVFLAITLYLALNIKMGVSSDSWYHLRVSQEFSKTLSIPENNPNTYQWRDIEHIPYLYFWINARFLNLNSVTFNFNEAILLRVINVFYSMVTLVGAYLLSSEFFKKKWLRLLLLFFLTNTLMFAFLSSSINYDNLANLFSVFSILFFVRALKQKKDWKNILLMLVMIGLGGLTKFTTLPLSFILIILTSFEVIRNWQKYKQNFKGKQLYLLIPLLFLVLLNFGVYGVNLLKFQSLQPECTQVLTYEQCLENGVFLRDNEWIPAQEVKLFDMIINGERLDPIRYFGVWVWEMAKRIYGMMGDRQLFAFDYIIPFYILPFVTAWVIAIVKWKEIKKSVKYLSIVSIFYLLVLLIVQNYNMYLKRGYPALALQGRYIFPVIVPFYILLIYFLNLLKPKWLRVLLFVFLIILFVLGCWVFFFANVDPDWFGAVDF